MAISSAVYFAVPGTAEVPVPDAGAGSAAAGPNRYASLFCTARDGCRDVRVLIFTGPQSVKVQRAARQFRVVRFCVCQRLVDLRVKRSGRQLFVPVLFRRLRALLVVRDLRLYLLRVQPFKLTDGLVGGVQLLLQAVGTRRCCIQVRLWRIQLVDFCLQLFFQLPGVGVTQQLFGKFQCHVSISFLLNTIYLCITKGPP